MVVVTATIFTTGYVCCVGAGNFCGGIGVGESAPKPPSSNNICIKCRALSRKFPRLSGFAVEVFNLMMQSVLRFVRIA